MASSSLQTTRPSCFLPHLQPLTPTSCFASNNRTHPPFPPQSDSFQDFWARRWNLTTTYMMRVLVYEPVVQGRLLPYNSGTAEPGTAGGTGQDQNRGAVAAIKEEIKAAAAKRHGKGGAQHEAVGGAVGGAEAAGSRSVAEAVEQDLVAAAKQHQQEQEKQHLAAEPAGPLEGGGKQVRWQSAWVKHGAVC